MTPASLITWKFDVLLCKVHFGQNVDEKVFSPETGWTDKLAAWWLFPLFGTPAPM